MNDTSILILQTVAVISGVVIVALGLFYKFFPNPLKNKLQELGGNSRHVINLKH